MAQDITLMGANYADVPAVNLPKQGGGTARFDDTSDATATAEDIAQGKTAYVDGSKITGTASGGGVGLSVATGGFVAEQDYNYNGAANLSYTGSILVNTGLSDIVAVCVWDEAWADKSGERPRFGVFWWASSDYFDYCPALTDSASSPYYYGFGWAMNATASSWYGGSGNSGPIVNAMTTSVPKGSFGIKTHSAAYPIKAGSTIRWKAWGTI